MFQSKVFYLFALMIAITACTKQETDSEEKRPTETRTAVADMSATMGNEASGTVTFTMTDNGMRVVAHFEGVPAGVHGFHIHEFGDCSSGDGTSAGGHFNPENMPHGGPQSEQRHIGDLGNITADESGVAETDFVDAHLTFDGPNSILGKGVILHADADDLTSQPTGAAGGRISCGVIEETQ